MPYKIKVDGLLPTMALGCFKADVVIGKEAWLHEHNRLTCSPLRFPLRGRAFDA